MILRHVQRTKNGLISLINLQQNRRFYDFRCNYDSHESRSWGQESRDKGPRERDGDGVGGPVEAHDGVDVVRVRVDAVLKSN